jgi:signal peptidase II
MAQDTPAAEAPPATPAIPAPVVEALPPVEDVIPGDRLGVPAGATRVIADYGRPRASYVFLAVVSLVSLASDIGSKTWAEQHLERSPVDVVINHLSLRLAQNRGGAWGLLQSTSENVRRPFFLLVSLAAIAFIMTLYRRLQPRQRALQWGLPLVLGGALGNVFDRIRYGHVIDFIDYRADWMGKLNQVLFHSPNDHWPTFNIADVAICVGVGLMAVDMFTSKRGPQPPRHAPYTPPSQSGEPSVDWRGAPLAEMGPTPLVEAAPAASDVGHVPPPPAGIPPTE